MREVIHTDCSPGVQEIVAKLQDVQLPPVVGASRIDLIAEQVAEKVTHCVEDLAAKYPGVKILSSLGPRHYKTPVEGDTTLARTDTPKITVLLPAPEAKAVVPAKQLLFLKNLINPAQEPAVLPPPADAMATKADPQMSTTQLITAPQAPLSPSTFVWILSVRFGASWWRCVHPAVFHSYLVILNGSLFLVRCPYFCSEFCIRNRMSVCPTRNRKPNIFCLSLVGWIVLIGAAEEELRRFKFCAKTCSAPGIAIFEEPSLAPWQKSSLGRQMRQTWRFLRKSYSVSCLNFLD